MNLRYLLLPVIAVGLGGSLRAQAPDDSPSSSASPGVEERGGGWHHHHERWLFRELQLTAPQRQQLKAYRSNNRAAFRNALLSYLQAKASLQSAINQNNTANLAGLASNVATAQAQLIQLRAQAEEYIVSNVLTSNQKNVWDQIQAKRASRLQDRISKLQAE
ncbi:MAG: Spy/CpxP family protein refolding chaperone [Verrucomicrobia bacterium]|nr:Spy/CpxP family protein refolding chaperone [Verrucomicrobiota bacterium]